MGRRLLTVTLLLASGCAQEGETEPVESVLTADARAPIQRVMGWADLRRRPLPVPDATLSYGNDPLNVVDIWQPEGEVSTPVVIMIHGGCWKTRVAERNLMNWIADDLRQHGVGVWNIEYRGTDTNGGYPTTYRDVGLAADLLREKGQDYGLRTDKVIAIGHSSGGHLALWLGNRTSLPSSEPLRGANPIEIDLVISQGGLPDLAAGGRRNGHPCGTNAPRRMAGPNLAITSPPEMKPGRTRQVLFNNTLDGVAPPQYARAYVSKMAARNVAVGLTVTPAEGHVELIAPESASWSHQRALILQEFGLSQQKPRNSR